MPPVSSDLPEDLGVSASETGRSPQVLLFGLAPHGVCRASSRHRPSGALLPHPFTLTCPRAGGLLSVALSVASPRLAVSEHVARWSSDFPRRAADRSALAATTSDSPPRPSLSQGRSTWLEFHQEEWNMSRIRLRSPLPDSPAGALEPRPESRSRASWASPSAGSFCSAAR